MISTKFGAVLEELSRVLDKKFAPDKNNMCVIKYPDQMVVMMEPDTLVETLYVAIEITKPGEGRFRENVLKEALKANGLPFPRTGVFCYGSKKDVLILFDQLPFAELTGVRLADIINSLLQKARLWKTSIDRGEVPSCRATELTFGASTGPAPHIFGM